MPGTKTKKRIDVFVHLATSHDAREWHKQWKKRTLIGINDPSPYGYARAGKMGCRVRFSRAIPEWFGERALRLGLRFVLGFDFVHALRNADRISRADAVWTHTESQFLAVAALMRLRGESDGKQPKLIGQAVWLIDNWPKLSFFHKRFYRWLIERLDVLIVHSEDNAALARQLFPDTRVELVMFGIPNESPVPVEIRQEATIRVLCLGNDRDRDWQTAIAAIADQAGIELTIVSSAAKHQLSVDADNVKVTTVSSNDELRALFGQSTLMLVPLKPNKHASGITVVQEAALLGLPVLATDTGGLRQYFGEEAVTYVPAFDAVAIRNAIRRLGGEPRLREKLARAAQKRATSGEIGCNRYITRHVELTRDLLSKGRVAQEDARH